jgi:hypothetical protein
MIETILIALTALYIYERIGITAIEDTALFDYKPFNCVFCISFWCSIALSVIYEQPLYLSIPLLYRVTQVKLLR